jgi:predicted transcriptional regulator|tara:strand:+ start:488 stop:934 length:447 start_codon:yes stop_codon:yes gene_type:complete
MVKDIPLSEIILRKYEKPIGLEKRELVRKICLSLGLLQLGDSRDVIVDILLVLINANKTQEKISSEEIRLRTEALRKKYSLETKGLAESNIRRQLKRLRDNMLIEKSENKYYLTEHSSLREIFENTVEKFLIPQIVERIKEYLDELEK